MMKAFSFLVVWYMIASHVFLTGKNALFQAWPGFVDDSAGNGEKLYSHYCVKCHGVDGTKGRFGAKNLQKSTLTDEQYMRIIQKGKGIMPRWEKKLSPEEIADIIAYIKTLKK